MRAKAHRSLFIVVFASSSLLIGPGLAAPIERDRSAQSPARQGRTISARDGDTVLMDGDVNIRFVRRHRAVVRAMFDESGRWVILLADVAKPDRDPDGRVDLTYTFRELTGTWPLGPRWEGQVVIDEHSGAPGGPSPQHGLSLHTDQGTILLRSGTVADPAIQEPHTIAVVKYRGSGRSMSTTMTFDQAEQHATAELERNIAHNTERARQGLPPMTTFSSEGPARPGPAGVLVGPYVTSGQDAVPLAAGGPVRVGSRIQSPRKIHDVPPVLPEDARRAGVRGMVVLELTVGADGAVTDAKVLRSIPLLDKAALDAARQWRYEPTMLNDQPVSVVVTAVVNFP